MPFYFYSNRNPDYKFCLFHFYVTQQIKLNHFVQLEIFSRYNSLKVAISIQLKPFFSGALKCLSVLILCSSSLRSEQNPQSKLKSDLRLEKAVFDFFQTVTGNGSSGNKVQMVRELHTGHCGSFALTFTMTFIWRVSAVGARQRRHIWAGKFFRQKLKKNLSLKQRYRSCHLNTKKHFYIVLLFVYLEVEGELDLNCSHLAVGRFISAWTYKAVTWPTIKVPSEYQTFRELYI